MDEISDDEHAVLRFLHVQHPEQATHVQATLDNRYLRAEMTENPDAIRDVLERLADGGYVDYQAGSQESAARMRTV